MSSGRLTAESFITYRTILKFASKIQGKVNSASINYSKNIIFSISIFTARNGSCEKVMFSLVSVCPQGMGGYVWFHLSSGVLSMLGPFWGWVCPGGGQVGMPDPISLWGDEYAWFQVPSGGGWVCPGWVCTRGGVCIPTPLPDMVQGRYTPDANIYL